MNEENTRKNDTFSRLPRDIFGEICQYFVLGIVKFKHLVLEGQTLQWLKYDGLAKHVHRKL